MGDSQQTGAPNQQQQSQDEQMDSSMGVQRTAVPYEVWMMFDKSTLFVQSYHLHSKNKLTTQNPYSTRNRSAGPRSPILSWIAVWARSITPTTLTSMWMASPIPQRPTTIASVWVSCPTSTGILPSRTPEGTLERVSPLKIPLLCRTGFSLVVRSSMLWTLISVSDWHAYDRHQKRHLAYSICSFSI